MSSVTSTQNSCLSITSLITDYLGSKNKEIEDAIYKNFSQESIPKGREIETLVLRIFKEQRLNIKVVNCRYSRYIIETDDGKKLIDNSFCRFRGGLNTSAKTMEIFIEFHKQCAMKINLLPTVRQRLLEYIIKGLPHPKFCCFDFSRFLSGKYIPRSRRSPKPFKAYWIVSKFPGENLLLPGNFVALYTEKCKQSHHAFYLGKELYLSVAGDGGDLAVMGLEDMAACWKARNVFLLTPFENYPRPPFKNVFCITDM